MDLSAWGDCSFKKVLTFNGDKRSNVKTRSVGQREFIGDGDCHKPTFLARSIEFHSDDPLLVDVRRGWIQHSLGQSGWINRGQNLTALRFK